MKTCENMRRGRAELPLGQNMSEECRTHLGHTLDKSQHVAPVEGHSRLEVFQIHIIHIFHTALLRVSVLHVLQLDGFVKALEETVGCRR